MTGLRSLIGNQILPVIDSVVRTFIRWTRSTIEFLKATRFIQIALTILAAGAIGFCLIGGRLVAAPLGAHVDTVLLIQIVISIALFPVLSRLVSRLDGKRRSR